MRIVNIHEAKTNLSRLLDDAVEQNKPFIIAKSGNPLVKVAPIQKKKRKIIFGLMKGKIKVSDDFDHPSQEIIEMFEGKLK